MLQFPISTIDAQWARAKISDTDPPAAIRGDQEDSPFTGEGHGNVWAQLHTLRGIRVSRARVLRLIQAQ